MFSQLGRAVAAAKARQQAAADLVQREAAALAEAEQQRQDARDALDAAQLVATTVQEQVHERLAVVVTQCLAAVFDDPYTFILRFNTTKKGRTEVEMAFARNGVEADPMTAAGGGVVDVASFALRLACLCLSRPPLRRLVVLDEPFKFVSQQYRDRIRNMLETLAAEMGVQFLMVTHVDELRCGHVVEVG